MRSRPRPRTPPTGRPDAADPSGTALDSPGPQLRRARSDRPTTGDPGSNRDTTAVRLAAVGLVVAVIALALGVRSTLFGGSSASSCQTLAWNSVPAASSLPSGWSIAGSTFTSAGLSSKLSGPPPADGSSASTTVYATVDCLGDKATEAVARNRAAASDAGMTVAAIDGVGDEAYSTTDATTGAMAIQFRQGELVGYAAATGAMDASDLQAIVTAFDGAMQHALAGGTPAPAGPAASGPANSPEGLASPSSSESAVESPSASAAAPELEALLPGSVAGTTLTRTSAIGASNLGSDPESRALSAALHNLGADPANLHLADAFDESGTIDLSMLAFSMNGITTAQLKTALLTAWLSAQSPGVKTSSVTLSGHQTTAVDYGDQGAIAYVLILGDAVVVIQTADRSLADKAAAALG